MNWSGDDTVLCSPTCSIVLLIAGVDKESRSNTTPILMTTPASPYRSYDTAIMLVLTDIWFCSERSRNVRKRHIERSENRSRFSVMKDATSSTKVRWGSVGFLAHTCPREPTSCKHFTTKVGVIGYIASEAGQECTRQIVDKGKMESIP